MVWVQLADRQRGFSFAPPELPFTGADVRQLELGQAVRIDQATFHTLRRQQTFAEFLTLVPEPTWT